jgi:phenylalanyl-tRNA synthetase beta chain
MKLSLNWISEFVDLSNISIEEILLKMNTSICEVEGVEEPYPNSGNAIWCEVIDTKSHPSSDSLSVCSVTNGKNNYQIITNNLSIQKNDIILTLLSPCVWNGKKIEETKIKGILSQGMFLSESDVINGWSSEIALLSHDKALLGKSLKETLDFHDSILEIDNKSITHRPDLWSHFGFAREFSAQFNRKLISSPFDVNANEIQGEESYQVQKSDFAKSYLCLKISNVKVEKSNLHIASRLSRCGLKSINNIVDISNYLLLEMGQPSHFFDYDRLPKGKIEVKLSNKGDSFPLLDDTSPILPEGINLISIDNKPQAIAGIIGGKDSSVTHATTNLLLESAMFSRELTRKGIRTLSIRTDSAQRYEKGLDSFTCKPIIYRALDLLKKNNIPFELKHKISGFEEGNKPSKTIQVSHAFIKSKIGKDISKEEIIQILDRLRFEVQESNGTFHIRSPWYRQNYDVTIPEDIIEEIGRTIGYANIPTQPLKMEVITPTVNQDRKIERSLKSFFSSSLHFNEIFSYSFGSDSEWIQPSHKRIQILNEMPIEHKFMRSSIYNGLFRSIKSNQDRFEFLNLFELGRIYSFDEKQTIVEKKILGFVKTTPINKDFETLQIEYHEIKQKIMKYISTELNIEITQMTSPDPNFHSGTKLRLECGGLAIAELGILSYKQAQSLEIKNYCIMGQIFIGDLINSIPQTNKSKFKIPSEFPEAVLDLSFVVPMEEKSDKIHEIVKKSNIKDIYDYYFVGQFLGGNLPEGKKSISFRFKCMNSNATYNQDSIQTISKSLIDSASSIGWNLR